MRSLSPAAPMRSWFCSFLLLLFALQAGTSNTAAAGLPEGLTAADWASIREAYERHGYAASAMDGGYRARNPRQQWTIFFDGRGFTANPDHKEWTWGLELASYGYAGDTKAVAGSPRMINQGERVSYEWGGGLEEWFVNDRRGLEHGFTVQQAPEGEGDTLELNLHVRGGLTARVGADGLRASFVREIGEVAVEYAGLKAWDADGKPLDAKMETVTRGLRFTVDVRRARFPVTIDPVAQQAYIKASNTGLGDFFGSAIALSGDTLAVGALLEDGVGVGVNPNTQGDDGRWDSGAVYVFRRTNGVWTQEAYLKASNSGANYHFGSPVALSGETLAVGSWLAQESGAVYVFERAAGVWSQQAYLKASNPDEWDSFGVSIALDGDTLAVGAVDESSNGRGINPNTQGDNSARASGAVYVFQRTAGVWSQQAYLKASNADRYDSFGSRLALADDTLAVSAPWESSSGVGVNSNTQDDNSAPLSGAVYVFLRAGDSWSQQAYIKASNTGTEDFFGGTLALSGDTLAVGAAREDSAGTGVNPNAQGDNSALESGAVYVFRRTHSVWAQHAYLKASNTEGTTTPASSLGDGFGGGGLSLSGRTLAISALFEDSGGIGVNPDAQSDNSVIESGAVYLFRRRGASWEQRSYLKASNTGENDRFGQSIAVSGKTLAVGGPGEASNGVGVNPPNVQANNSAESSGAVYLFDATFPDPAHIGSYRNGVWSVDRNGDGAFSPGVDSSFDFGFDGATPVTGDWNGDGILKAGLFANGFWFLDYDGNGIWDGGVHDRQYHLGWEGVTPLVGDWDADGTDTIGIFINGFWFLDADGDGVWDGPGTDIQAQFGWNGVTPFVGDWNGDGRDKIGIYINGFWYLDYDGNAAWDGPVTDRQAEFGWAGVTPLVGDWDGDGTETVGIYINGFWFLDADGDGLWDGPGADIQAQFGWSGVTPAPGDWNGDGRDKIGIFVNGIWYLDYDGSAVWDGGVQDKAYAFGQAGSTPVAGPW